MELVAFQESEQGKKNETSNASNASHVEIEEYESPHMFIIGQNFGGGRKNNWKADSKVTGMDDFLQQGWKSQTIGCGVVRSTCGTVVFLFEKKRLVLVVSPCG